LRIDQQVGVKTISITWPKTTTSQDHATVKQNGVTQTPQVNKEPLDTDQIKVVI
jgi:hypothetical protein